MCRTFFPFTDMMPDKMHSCLDIRIRLKPKPRARSCHAPIIVFTPLLPWHSANHQRSSVMASVWQSQSRLYTIFLSCNATVFQPSARLQTTPTHETASNTAREAAPRWKDSDQRWVKVPAAWTEKRTDLQTPQKAERGQTLEHLERREETSQVNIAGDRNLPTGSVHV